jgi:predicted CXXCH cytochrome family protein
MAFLLRMVSTSAEGREIVRTARIDGDRLTIGRNPDSNVHLTDLAVALRHASTMRSGARLIVTAEEGLTVELNGRKAASGWIEISTGGDLRIGSHLLRFMPAEAGSDEIRIDVERVTEGEVKLDRSAERLFSLASVMPGKRPMAWIFLLLVLGICLAWPIKSFYDRQQTGRQAARFHPDQIWSSGPLSRAHAALSDNCTACHVKPFEAVRDTACASCHKSIHEHADPFRLARAQPDLTRWGAFKLSMKETFNIPPGRCVDCHTEHEGPREMPVTPQRFCSDCHAGLDRKLRDTRIGNAADFGRAHPEFKPALITGWSGERPQMQRISLSARPREANGLKFPHALHLSPTGGVAQMGRRLGSEYGFGPALQCRDCHRPEPQGASFQPVDMESDCAMCHSLAFARVGGTVRTLRHGDPAQVVADLRDFYRLRSPSPPPSLVPTARRRPGQALQAQQRAQFARGVHSSGIAEAVRAVFSRGGACYDCHQVSAPSEGSSVFRIQPVAFPTRYIRHGWFDHRPHATQSCSSCHAAAQSSSASDLLLPGINSCRTCHGGERTSKPVASSCAMCHDYHGGEGAPSMIIRKRVRGQKRAPTVASRERPR